MLYLNGQPLNVTVFPDNTSQVWKLPEEIFSKSEVVIKWTFSHEGEFMQLAQLKHLLGLKSHYGPHIRLILTYLPYGRQDKEITNESTFALRTFAVLLNKLNFDAVIIHDPHSEVALELIKNSHAYYPKEKLNEVIKETGTNLLCYPDKGALRKYSEQYEFYQAYIYGEKVRDQLTGNITSYKVVGDCAGKNVLIVDDICDGGATFKLLAKDLLAAGAKSVSLFATHGIFSKGVRTLFDSGISRIFTEDEEIGKRHDTKQF
jgi:ribose-phosphate pyrophosphokinase